MHLALRTTLAAACLTAVASAQTPELLYYTFDEGTGTTTANLANPGVGSNPATVNGHTLSPAGGQFGGGLTGVGGTSGTNFVDSGWATNLTGDFTMGYYIDVTAVASGTFQYISGDNTAGSFRTFTNGAAGTNNIIMRGTLTQCIIPGGADPLAPHVVTWVYDSTVPEIRGYLDGVLVVNTPQTSVSISGTGPFKVGGYSTSTAMAAGVIVDEFRFYDRALSGTEIAATWNIPLGGGATTYCTAKVNSLGCTPAISGTGVPSATATSGFSVDVDMVRNNKSGLFFYSVNGAQANVTFQCGTLCVGPTGIKRTPAQSAGGNAPPANDCSGVYSLDFNAFGQGLAGGNPDPALMTMGTVVHAQVWGRDQGFAAPCNTTLSDGLEWTQGT